MNKLKGTLPIIAFVFAAFAAVAFTSPEEDGPMYGKTLDENNEEVWIHVNPPGEPEVEYNCDVATSDYCLYSTPDESSPITSTANREFVLIP